MFFGSEVRAALDGTRGFLHGEKRRGQVDVFGLRPVEGGLRKMVAARFDGGLMSGWPVVGIAIASGDLPEAEDWLLRELVAGDLVVAAGPRALAHCGDALRRCRVIGPGSRKP